MNAVVSKREVLTPDDFPFAAEFRAEGQSWQQAAEGIGADLVALRNAIKAHKAEWQEALAQAEAERLAATGGKALKKLGEMLDTLDGKSLLRACEVVVKLWLGFRRTGSLAAATASAAPNVNALTRMADALIAYEEDLAASLIQPPETGPADAVK